MTIRPYSSSDESAVLDVWLRSTTTGQNFISRDFWESQTETVRTQYLPAADTFIAEEGDGIVGFISLLGDHIGGLFVEPELQGRRIGTALLEHAGLYRGRPLTVDVYEKNTKARAFYAGRGFEERRRSVQEETGETLIGMEQRPGAADEAPRSRKRKMIDTATDVLTEGVATFMLSLLLGGD